MELPIELRISLEEQARNIKRIQLENDAKNISERYRNKSGTGKRLLTMDSEAVAYAIVRMPATYGAVNTVLDQILCLYDGDIKSLLDVGAGTGAATWAASEQFDLDHITCLERESAMIKLGTQLMQNGNEALKKANWKNFDLSSEKIQDSADLVIASYVLNEMTDSERSKAVEMLWNSTKKILLLVEPGTPVGYKQLRIARESLLSKGAHIIAPCTHEKECHIKDQDWCHFTCRIQRSKLHKQLKEADAPYEDEKFTYLAVAKIKSRYAENRILRHPLIESGKITLTLCNQDGIYTKCYTKKNPLFKKARKAKCGDSLNEEGL